MRDRGVVALGTYVTEPPALLPALLPLIGTRLQLQRLGTTGGGSLGFDLISFLGGRHGKAPVQHAMQEAAAAAQGLPG